MSANITNQVAYLRTSRNFPDDPQELSVQLSKSYIDIARAVNDRTIGIYPTQKPAVTGESFYITKNQKQQTLRQVFSFTATTSITHGITVTDTNQFTCCYGSYSDGINSYGLIFGTSVAVAGLISFYVSATQIVFVLGAGAPGLTSGRIILQWLSSP